MEKNTTAQILASCAAVVALLTALLASGPPALADTGRHDPGEIPIDISQPGQLVKCNPGEPPIVLPPPFGSGSTDTPAGPRCADLVITELTVNPRHCSAAITVANVGIRDAGAFRLSGASASKSVEGLAASSTIRFRLGGLVFDGDLSIFTVDVDDQVIESNERNNIGTAAVPDTCQHLQCNQILASRPWPAYISGIDEAGRELTDLGSFDGPAASFRAIEHAGRSLYGATINGLWEIDVPAGAARQVADIPAVSGLGQDSDGTLLAIGLDTVLRRIDPASNFAVVELGSIVMPNEDMVATSLVVLPDGRIVMFAWNLNPNDPGQLVVVDLGQGDLTARPVGGELQAWIQSMAMFDGQLVLYGSDHQVLHVDPVTFNLTFSGTYSHEREWHGATTLQCDLAGGLG